jgi:hypothetical protein
VDTEHVKEFEKHKIFKNEYGEYKPFFARKFTDSSTKIIEMIEDRLR